MALTEPNDTDKQPAPAPETDPLALAKKEAAENYDKFVRSVADLENFRRRTLREKDELRLYGNSAILEELLPVLDTLGLGLSAARQPGASLDSLAGGVDLVLAQLKAVLAKHGLKEVNPAGLPFDPHLHEAISHQPDAKVKEEHVLTVVRPGFTLNGRLLRPASVIVSSGLPSEASAKAGPAS